MTGRAPVATRGSITVEVAVEDVAGARIAVDGGAHRLELCSALTVGGLTPTPALAAAVVDTAGETPVFAMIRCRPGDFVFDDTEVDLMAVELADLRSTGVAGVVIGAVTADGAAQLRLDDRALGRLVEAADGLQVTIHRAFDLATDVERALATAIDLGADRVLSSGGAPTAPAGASRLGHMVDVAANRITVLAGVGVTSDNVIELLEGSGVREVHGTARGRKAPSPTVSVPSEFGDRTQPDRAEVERIVAATQRWQHS